MLLFTFLFQLVPPAAVPVAVDPTLQRTSESMNLADDDSDVVTCAEMLYCQPCAPHRICLSNLKQWNCKEVGSDTDFNWRPCDCGSSNVGHGSQMACFTDVEDPRRLPFDPSLNYTRGEDGTFQDARVQNLYRNLQLANQMHRCCFTCWKYCFHIKRCRFGYPRCLCQLRALLAKEGSGFSDLSDPTKQAMAEGYMRIRIDGNSRKRNVVEPAFNNAHLNNHAFSPLLFIAQRANMDIKYMEDNSGTVEYIGSYISKTEQPDFKKVGNIYIKKIAGITRLGKTATDLNKLNAVGNALIDSQVVGAPQMCFVLLGLPFVIFSRQVEVVNPLPQEEIRRKIIGSEARSFAAPEQSAVNIGATSHFGKRKAYSALIMLYAEKQWDCKVTYYALRTQYTTSLIPKKPPKALRELDHPLAINETTGFISESEVSFKAGEYMFTKRKKQAVIHLSPHIPIDTKDEHSAYSILLLHCVWPDGREENIRPPGHTARERLAEMRQDNQLLPHVQSIIDRISASEETFAEIQEEAQQRQRESAMADAAAYNRDGNVGDYDSGDEGPGGKQFDGDGCAIMENAADYLDDSEAESGLDEDNGDTEPGTDRPQPDSSDPGKFLSATAFTVLESMDYVKAIQTVETAIHAFNAKQAKTMAAADQLINGPLPLRRQEGASGYQPVDNLASRKVELLANVDKCDEEQQKAFRQVKEALDFGRMCDAMDNALNEQLIMFVSGEGGTGKSHLIKIVTEHAALKFGKSRRRYGHVIRWAPTGCAAFNIGGVTWQSGVKMRKYRSKKKANVSDKYREIGTEIEDAKMLILDEVSMIGLEDLVIISDTLARARATLEHDEEEKQRVLKLPFGGLHVLFVGDLYQLPPVERTAIFSRNWKKTTPGKEAGLKVWGQINAYVRLIKNHRVNQANELEKQFAAALSEFREGSTRNTLPMINYLNRHNVVANEEQCIAVAPKVSSIAICHVMPIRLFH